jgi:DNA-binding NarL/FixJ family response regulator
VDNKQNIRVILADDHSIFRDGIRVGLGNKDKIEIIAEADNGVELLRLLDQLETDVILLDIRMPQMDGFEALSRIRQSFPDIRIIVLTMYDDENMVVKMMENGANGYLIKNAPAKEIYQAILSVYNEHYYFNDLVNKALLKHIMLKSSRRVQDDAVLTESEKKVLKLLMEDKSLEEIKDSLFLSARSVAGIIARLKSKTGYKTTAGLIMYAIKNDMTDTNPEKS